MILASQGKYEEAIKAFDMAISGNDKYALAYNNRGAAKFKLEYYREAVKDFNIALKLDPGYANAYVNRGIAREMARDQVGACEDWHKATELGHEGGRKLLIGNCSE
jgi:tetratricopeptide (TPR) repeat protein